jgi:hypothetical protein
MACLGDWIFQIFSKYCFSNIKLYSDFIQFFFFFNFVTGFLNHLNIILKNKFFQLASIHNFLKKRTPKLATIYLALNLIKFKELT